MKIKFLTILYYLGMCMLIVGYLFKIQHWPYGFEILIGGIVLIGVSGLIDIIKTARKKK